MIETQPEFEARCAALREARRFGLDLEFVREKSYFPQICLVQLSANGEEALVDPLAGLDLSLLKDLIADAAVVKIVHAGGQDLELLADGRRPHGVFDTQIAASFLGFGDAIGYADLCRRMLGVSLRKAGQVADWDRRPLSPKLLKYAVQDVAHLPALHDCLTRRLEERGRLAWATEEFERMEERVVPEAQPAWTRVKGAGGLEGRDLAVLEALADWREMMAAKRDLPRQRIVNDRTMIELALQAPTTRDALRVSRFFRDEKIDRYGNAILDAVRRGLASKPPERRRSPDSPGVPQSALDLLAAFAKSRADALDIAPPRLATRDDIADLAVDAIRGSRDSRLMAGWRFECVGRELVELMEGRLAVRIRNRRVEAFAEKRGRRRNRHRS